MKNHSFNIFMDDEAVSSHYGISGILDSILKGLESSGKNLQSLVPNDLAPIDEFHTRGKESTIEIANLAQLQFHHNVLDVGCGLGGSARYIANEFGCSVMGVDLTDEYINVANKLTEFVNLSNKVSFKQIGPFSGESIKFSKGTKSIIDLRVDKAQKTWVNSLRDLVLHG